MEFGGQKNGLVGGDGTIFIIENVFIPVEPNGLKALGKKSISVKPIVEWLLVERMSGFFPAIRIHAGPLLGGLELTLINDGGPKLDYFLAFEKNMISIYLLQCPGNDNS